MLTELTRIATTPLPRVYSSLLLLLLGGVVARSRYIGSQGSHTAEDMSNMLDSSGNLWNGETVPRDLARGVLGWNPYQDVVGAGVYGGIVKRDAATGRVLLGHEWPENNAGEWIAGDAQPTSTSHYPVPTCTETDPHTCLGSHTSCDRTLTPMRTVLCQTGARGRTTA